MLPICVLFGHTHHFGFFSSAGGTVGHRLTFIWDRLFQQVMFVEIMGKTTGMTDVYGLSRNSETIVVTHKILLRV